jgi:hypothetical protein
MLALLRRGAETLILYDPVFSCGLRVWASEEAEEAEEELVGSLSSTAASSGDGDLTGVSRDEEARRRILRSSGRLFGFFGFFGGCDERVPGGRRADWRGCSRIEGWMRWKCAMAVASLRG